MTYRVTFIRGHICYTGNLYLSRANVSRLETRDRPYMKLIRTIKCHV